MATEKKPDWDALSSDNEETKQNRPQAQHEKEEQKHENEEKPQGRTFQQKKIVMQHRSEIDQLIDDNPAEQIILNIVKCHFDATVDDVKAAFANHNFVEVQNYNPGSFSLEFATKDEAKSFVEETRNVKILGRGFWVKFPVMHQKQNKTENSENREQGHVKKTYENRRPQQTQTELINYIKNSVEGGEGHRPQFSRGTGATENYQKPRTYNPNQHQNKPHYKKPRNEEDEWTTVGLNSKPIEVPKKHYYNNQGNKGDRSGQQRRQQQQQQ